MALLFKRQNSNTKLIEAVKELIAGARANAGTIALPADFESALTSDRDNLVVAMKSYKTARDTEATRRRANEAAFAEADAYLNTVVGVLRPRIGSRLSPGWGALALPPRSLALPADNGQRLERLEAAKGYFTANPLHEVASLNATAAQATLLLGKLEMTEEDLNAAIAAMRAAKADRDRAATQLTFRGRSAAETLSALLEPEDERWYAFGLRRPIDIRIPDAPNAPRVTASAPGTLEIEVERPARARRARIFLQRQGDQEPQPVATIRDWKTTLKGIAPGVVQVTVSGANGSGEGLQSAPVTVTVS